jgi:hypothetical protein
LANGENAIRISIYHDKGGINYFNYKTEPEGYWVSTGAVTVADGGITERLHMGGDGIGRRYYVAPSSRFNFKKLQALAGFVATRKDQIAGHVVAQDHETIRVLLEEARREVFGIAA